MNAPFAKMSLRCETRIRELTSRWRTGAAPKRIIFIHIPKSAGTSVMDYFRTCIGSKKSGRTVKLDEFVLGKRIDDAAFERARRARYCTGHISWAAVEKIRDGSGDFVFTVLRDPRRRLWSLYNFLHGNAFPATMIPRELADLYADITHMSPREFLCARDERLRYIIDNVMVRQLSGNMPLIPDTQKQADPMLEAAKANIAKLDYVAFTETFDRDFVRIVEAVDLPPARQVPHAKKSVPTLKDATGIRDDFSVFEQETGDLIDPLAQWDQLFYDWAVTTYRDRAQQR
jgi:Sulfotransferase family